MLLRVMFKKIQRYCIEYIHQKAALLLQWFFPQKKTPEPPPAYHGSTTPLSPHTHTALTAKTLIQHLQPPSKTPNAQKTAPPGIAKKKETAASIGCSSNHSQQLASLQALRALQKLSPQINQEGRAAAITTLLQDNSLVFAAIRQQRWPDGVRCPRCHSTRVVRRYPTRDVTLLLPDQWFYRCLDCEGMGTPTEFDDTTNIDILHSTDFIRQWISVFYLSPFCSPEKMARMLGISVAIITQLMFVSQEIITQFEKDRKEAEDDRPRRHNRPLAELLHK
jgi:hypothetical protein